MLEIAAKLPPGALVGGEERLLAQALLRSGGARFVAREADLVRHEGRITGWREAKGAVEAVAAAPNIGNSRFEAGPPGALVCSKGINCGFVLPGFAPAVTAFTVALVYSSGGEARTLASVSTGQAQNVIFLSEAEGRIVAKDKQNTVQAVLPLARSSRPRLAIVGYDGRSLWLQCDGQTLAQAGRVPGMDSPADFLIGCRSNRPGLTKLMGDCRIHEVIFWPDRALPLSEATEDAQALAVLARYVRWVY